MNRPSARSRRRLGVVALVVLVAAVAASALSGAPAPAAASVSAAPVQPGGGGTRLLVVSMPGLTWDDVAGNRLPALDEFLADAAVADLAPRGVSPRSGPGDAYLTIASGGRSTTDPEVDGQVLAVDEESSGSAAGEIFERRTGVAPSGPFVSLVWPRLVRLNDAQPYGAEPGLLTQSLAEAGVSAAVIGNADGTDSISPTYERQVALALADRSGQVPGGAIGKDILSPDVAKPFGVGLDQGEVVSRFEEAWRQASGGGAAGGDGAEGGVVLVEASDLARALRYRPIVDRARYRQLYADALADSDALFAELMDLVDPAKDTVLVVAPYNTAGDRNLTAVAMRGPDTEPGYLQSASTQRPGFLTLVDVAPTILDVFDIDRPDDMEGRPALVTTSGRSAGARIDHLITLNDASRFREQLLTPTTTVLVIGLAGVIAAAMVAHASRWSRRVRSMIRAVALVLLTMLPASYLTRLFALEERGVGFYWLTLSLFSVAFAAAAVALAARLRRPRVALVAVLGLMALVLVGDVVTGSNLSLSAAFGYSPTGNSRLYGISNYSYGQLAGASCLLAAWLAATWPDRRGRVAALVAMVATLVVLGVPIWGADVGGILAFTPTIAIFTVVLMRRRVRWRTVFIGLVATTAAVLVFGFLDLARAPGRRSHLGRLFERTGKEGLGPLLDLVQRKLLANLAVSTSSLWVAAIPLGIALGAYLWWFPGRPYGLVKRSFTTLDAALAGSVVAAVLGSALNDSGAIVGGVMSAVVSLALVALLMEGSRPEPTPVPGEAIGAG